MEILCCGSFYDIIEMAYLIILIWVLFSPWYCSCTGIILDIAYYPHVNIFSRVYYSHFGIFSREHNPHYPKPRRIGSWSGLCALYAQFSSNLGSEASSKNPAIPLFFSIRSQFIAPMLYLSFWILYESNPLLLDSQLNNIRIKKIGLPHHQESKSERRNTMFQEKGALSAGFRR